MKGEGLGRRGGEILVTTSHRPSRRVRSFVNDLARTLPRAVRVNRGKKSFEELRDLMRLAGYRVLIIVNTWKANPGRIDLYVREDESVRKIGSLHIFSIKLCREQGVSDCFFRSPEIDSKACRAPICRDAEDMLSQILGVQRYIDKLFDEKIHMEENRGKIYIWFSKRGRTCGPRIGVRAAYKEP